MILEGNFLTVEKFTYFLETERAPVLAIFVDVDQHALTISSSTL